MTRTADQSIRIGSAEDFAGFLDPYRSPAFLSKLSARLKEPHDVTSCRLNTYLNEMQFGHRFLAQRMPPGRLKILEVGAGLGLLSAYLKQRGHTVVALEPAAGEFGFFEATRDEIMRFAGKAYPKLLELPAEALGPEHGPFDFIFSMNVLEHVSELEGALSALANVLAPGGTWANSCPNYFFRYEPHYAIPLVPLWPGLSRKLHRKRIDADPETWDTLNFITWLQVKRLARKNGLDVVFEAGTLHASLKRM